MSCTDFPSTGLTPNVTTHTVGSVTYRWTGVAWESQVNVPWEDVLTNQQTTVDLVNSFIAYAPDNVVQTSGFTTAGDGGGAKWVQNGVTGQTPSQTPAQLGDALLNDASGNQWAYVLNKKITPESLGAVGDGLADDTLPIQAAIDYSNSAGVGIEDYSGNTYIISDIDGDRFCLLIGSKTNWLGNFTIKLSDGDNDLDAVVRIKQGATDVVLGDWVLDCNRANQLNSYGGNGLVGSDNCSNVEIATTVINCKNRSIVTNNDGNTPSTGLPPFFNSADNFTITSKVLNAGDKGVMFLNTKNSRAIGAYVETNITDVGNVGGSLFEASQAYNINFISCQGEHLGANQTLGPGLRTVNGSNLIKYTNCIAKGGRQNFFLTDCSDVTLLGCTGVNAESEGAVISVNASSRPEYAYMDNIKISKCDIINCGQDTDNAGIVIASQVSTGALTNVRLEGNTIKSNDGKMQQGIRNSATESQNFALEVIEENNLVVGNTTTDKVIGDFVGTNHLRASSVFTNSFTIGNDTARKVPAPETGNGGVFLLTTKDTPAFTIMLSYRAGATEQTYELASANPSMKISTGVLTGTTGDSNSITVSASTDGNLYIENRRGSNFTFEYLFLNPS